MNKNLCFFLLALLCSYFLQAQSKQEFPRQFSDTALNAKLINLQGDTFSFKEVLQKNQGKSCFVDMWASWCKDCIQGLPKAKKMFDNYEKNNHFLFLSIDKSTDKWKEAIDKYDLRGQHYLILGEWKNPIGNFIKLDWIPRYMVLDGKANIIEWKEIQADHKNIQKKLK